MKLCAAVWDCMPEEAARQMLELAGIADPDYREQWQRLTDWSQPPDVDALASALRAWCARTDPQWRVRQYDSGVAGKLAACLGLLSRVRTARRLPGLAGRLQEGDGAGTERGRARCRTRLRPSASGSRGMSGCA